MKLDGLLAITFLLAAAPGEASTYNLLKTFASEPGCEPESTLVETSPGLFYGTTGGCAATIFSITSAGTYITIADLSKLFVGYPTGALVHADDGLLYGETSAGGIFRSDLAGNVTVLVPEIGYGQNFPLIEDATGTFYGLRGVGASWSAFRMDHNGVLTTIHEFLKPTYSPLMKASDGNFYGTDDYSVYRMTPGGDVSRVFTIPYGPGFSNGALTQGQDGRLYGGLIAYPNAVYAVNLDGSGFEIIARVAQTTFIGISTGLALANDGNFYAGAYLGEGYPNGKLFSVTPAGQVTLLKGFTSQDIAGPVTPSDGMTQGTDGRLYGTQAGAQSSPPGAVYVIDNNLAPPAPVIAEFYPASGSPGTTVLIHGRHFLSTSSVTIGGVAAPFTVPSNEFLRITVPAGAVTAPIVITTPNGTTASAQTFTIQ